jgi:hypothetical protein
LAAQGLNINQFRERVAALLNALPEEIQRINNGLALSAIAEVRRRLIDRGIDGDGKSLGTYSTNPLPTFFFTNKGTGSGADKKLESVIAAKKKQAKSTGEKFKGVSYKEFREINNLPTAHVTLSFTGETLGDLGVVSEVIENLKIVTTVGAKNTKSKARYNAKGQKIGQDTSEQILDYLGEMYGEDLLGLTPAEEKNLGAALDDELQKLFDKYIEQ